jgi:hypothetical protein
MRQTELNRAVARATGETVERVSRMGFSLMPGPNAYPASPRDHDHATGRAAHRVAVCRDGRGSSRLA